MGASSGDMCSPARNRGNCNVAVVGDLALRRELAPLVDELRQRKQLMLASRARSLACPKAGSAPLVRHLDFTWNARAAGKRR